MHRLWRSLFTPRRARITNMPPTHSHHPWDHTRLAQMSFCAHAHRHQHPLVRIRLRSARYSLNPPPHPCRHPSRSGSVPTHKHNRRRRKMVRDSAKVLYTACAPLFAWAPRFAFSLVSPFPPRSRPVLIAITVSSSSCHLAALSMLCDLFYPSALPPASALNHVVSEPPVYPQTLTSRQSHHTRIRIAL